jgi:hypothetical protein
MTDKPLLDPLKDITRISASDIMRVGWSGVMKALGGEGTVLVTNRGEPEAVILSIQAYATLTGAPPVVDPAKELALEALRRSFDERLAALRAPDAGDRLRALSNDPTRLKGMVRAGSSC